MNTEIKVKELDEMLEECMTLKEEHKKIKDESAKVWHKYEQKYAEIIAILENEERDSYRSDDVSFSYKVVESFKTPKETDQRELFFQYLKDRNAYDNLITVNSRSLNSFAQQELEMQELEGNYGFAIPGITKGEPYFSPSIKRLKI